MAIRAFLRQHCFSIRHGWREDTDTVGQSDAAQKLQASILDTVGRIPFPHGLGIGTAAIVDGIRRSLETASFDRHNRDLCVVEVRARLTATTHEGCPVFSLVIIWYADVISQISHYGWEVYMDDVRVAGPGHVVLRPGCALKQYRRPGYEEVEEKSLRLRKCSALGTGTMLSQAHYYKLARWTG